MALGNVPFEKISVIPHGNYLDTISDIPQKDKARNKLRLPDDAKIILFFGQIKQVKGLDILLRAMKNVSLVYPDVLCVIAGRPWKLEFCEYELLIQSLKLEKNIVTDIRYIPDDDIRFYYSACDLVVLPYRRIYQSGVLLQAMSYQRPVLVSDLPGMTEIVSDGVNGYVFESGSHEALAEKIISFFNNRDASNKVGVRGMQYVKASHDWVSIGARTRDLYLECLSK
jgi:glycosyltransferase involved in cell wall biosynthesis